MTAVVLLDELKVFIENALKDLPLSVRPVKGAKDSTPITRPPEVYKMRLPSKDAETNRIPYVLLQFLTGKDDQQPGDDPDSECRVRIIAATYSEDGGEGANDLLNVMERIRIALLKSGEIAEQFLLRKPLERIFYPDDTEPYHLGELLSIWEMPEVHRELDNYYHDHV